ncbi:acyl-CoA dehydrogenase family protein [Streptomyces broussonetiae]|uniref:acyl-CoA dehydrogenase family protein n=1 Tax=Streptomyces broussonetiae TaxID=2686304 RepID=UPI0035E306D1
MNDAVGTGPERDGTAGRAPQDIDVALEAALEAARRDAVAVEERRALTPPLARALAEAGFPRHFVARRWGGTAGTFTALLRTGARLAEADGAAAWCAVLYAAHGRLASYLPHAGQRELWRSGPDVRIAASVVPPQGTAVEAPGGWRLSGRWGYASGVDHAHWVLLAALTGTGTERHHRIFAVPRAEVGVSDTWRSMGLRGTGSNTVTAEDVFVPAHRTMTLEDLLRPMDDAARCHRVPYPMVAGLLFAIPALGAARAAVREWARTVAPKRRPGGRTVGETASGRQAFARSAADIEAAGHLLLTAARRADEVPVSPLAVAENQRDAVVAVDLCRQAATRLFQTAGAAGLADTDRLQRCWRDVLAVAGHATLDPETAATAYAEAALTGAASAEVPSAAARERVW